MFKVLSFIGILIFLSIVRLIPHPPNFTSLVAISFYIPIIFGRNYLPFFFISYVMIDLLIGYHIMTHWTWGSIFLISLFSNFFKEKFYFRFTGVILGTLLFYLVTNFGVYTTGMYGYDVNGIIKAYILAIPFYGNTLISSILFALLIELINVFLNKEKRIIA